MSVIDRTILAEKVAAIERHFQRVVARLPPTEAEFPQGTDASDAVILHLWQAVQIAIDLAVTTCVRLKIGTPGTYAEALDRLREAGVIEAPLAQKLIRAAGFRNAVAHAYERLDLTRVFLAAREGPADLRAFLAALSDRS